MLESIYNNDETEVPLESHPPKAVASGCLLIFRKEVLTKLLLMTIDDGYNRLNYRRFLPEYWEYRHISKYMYMVRVGLYLRCCVDKVKQRVQFTMDVPETVTILGYVYAFKLLCSETAYLAYICS